MDRYRMKAILKTVGYTLLWLGIILFVLRQGVLTTKLVVGEGEEKKVEAKAPVVEQIPDAAKTTGRKFLIHWFYSKADESAQSKVERLEPLATESFVDRLEKNTELMILVDGKSKAKKTQANSIDVWKSHWVTKGKRAEVTYSVTLDDGRQMMLQVPLVNAGRWMVDGLPSVKPKEKKQKMAEEEPLELPDQKQVQEVVDGFFSAWFSGKEAAIACCTTQKEMKLTNILKELHGEYQGVEVEAIRRKPLQVRAQVKIQDDYGKNLVF